MPLKNKSVRASETLVASAVAEKKQASERFISRSNSGQGAGSGVSSLRASKAGDLDTAASGALHNDDYLDHNNAAPKNPAAPLIKSDMLRVNIVKSKSSMELEG